MLRPSLHPPGPYPDRGMNATARASAMPQRSAGGHYSRPRYSAIGGNSTFRRIMLPARGLAPRGPETATALIPQGNQRRAVHSVVARATGLEPATSGVTGRRSNQLSYARPRQGAGSMAVTKGCQAGLAGNSAACRSFLPDSAAAPAQTHRDPQRQGRNQRDRRPQSAPRQDCLMGAMRPHRRARPPWMAQRPSGGSSGPSQPGLMAVCAVALGGGAAPGTAGLGPA